MDCWFCGEKLIWQCDFDFGDYELDDEGLVAVLYCPNCNAEWEGYLKFKEKNN